MMMRIIAQNPPLSIAINIATVIFTIPSIKPVKKHSLISPPPKLSSFTKFISSIVPLKAAPKTREKNGLCQINMDRRASIPIVILSWLGMVIVSISIMLIAKKAIDRTKTNKQVKLKP